MVFKARLTQLDTRQTSKHQLLTFSDVSLVSLKTKKHQEKDYQNLLTGSLGHERLTPLNQIISMSKVVESQLASFSRVKTWLQLDVSDEPSVKELEPPKTLSEDEAAEMQLMLARVWSRGNVMLFMANSQQSHFFAESNTLQAVFKKLQSRASFMSFLNTFLLIFKIKMKNEGIELDLDVTKDFPENVFLEKTKYLEALFHLLMNSIKFAQKKDPRITILVTRVPFSDSQVVPDGWNGYLSTEVVDNGVGIEKMKQKTLFHTFRGKYTDMKQGVGIGLSTVRAIVEALCGEVTLDSEIGKGTKLCFTMPLAIKAQNMSQRELKCRLGRIPKPPEESKQAASSNSINGERVSRRSIFNDIKSYRRQ